jgi:CRISPR-associated endonuclease Cas1
MRDESITLSPITASQTGVVVLSGFGLRVAVERGHLTLADGRGRDRREGQFTRASRQLRRLILIGHSGTVSLDALRWLRDVGCAFVQVDSDGAVITASGASGLDDPRLRRAQALATGTETGVTIARDLLTRKLAGQAATVDRIVSSADIGALAEPRAEPVASIAATGIRNDLTAMLDSATITDLRGLESQAAARYWGAWATVPARWAKRDRERVPEHWQCAGVRSSPLTGSPRLATTPVQAMLNYAYAMLEVETRIALLTVGLDPGIGIVHADQRARDSLALDVMEAVRPDVDRWLLDTLASRTFARADFHETRQGVCRLMPPLARLLAGTAPQWAAAVAPVVEAVAHTLAKGPAIPSATTGAAIPRRSPPPLTTPLTQRNRSAGRDPVHGARKPKRPAMVPDAALPHTCRGCGTTLRLRTQTYCEDCYPNAHAEQVAETFTGSGLATLAELRASGSDPAHGGDAGRRRGKRNATHAAAALTWDRDGDDRATMDAETFTSDVLPGLRDVPLRVMASVTGLSESYCSFVRRGLKVPHRRHWGPLALLGIGQDD